MATSTDLERMTAKMAAMATEVRDGLSAIDREIALCDQMRIDLVAQRGAYLAALTPLQALFGGAPVAIVAPPAVAEAASAEPGPAREPATGPAPAADAPVATPVPVIRRAVHGRQPDPNSMAGQVRAWVQSRPGRFTLTGATLAFPEMQRTYLRMVLRRIQGLNEVEADVFEYRAPAAPPVEDTPPPVVISRTEALRTWVQSQPGEFTVADAVAAFPNCGNGWVGVHLAGLVEEGVLERVRLHAGDGDGPRLVRFARFARTALAATGDA